MTWNSHAEGFIKPGEGCGVCGENTTKCECPKQQETRPVGRLGWRSQRGRKSGKGVFQGGERQQGQMRRGVKWDEADTVSVGCSS